MNTPRCPTCGGIHIGRCPRSGKLPGVTIEQDYENIGLLRLTMGYAAAELIRDKFGKPILTKAGHPILMPGYGEERTAE